MKKVVTFCIALLLSACGTEQVPITQAPKDVIRTSGFVTKGLAGPQDIAIRAYQKTGEKNKIAEVKGAKCKIKGRGYYATVTTPSVVRIPLYGKASPSFSVYCQTTTSGGVASGSVFNVTLANRQHSVSNAGANGGLIGALLLGAIASGMKEKEGDVWAYPALVSAHLAPK